MGGLLLILAYFLSAVLIIAYFLKSALKIEIFFLGGNVERINSDYNITPDAITVGSGL